MIPPYELIYKLALPAVRAMIAKRLIKEYGFTQDRVAKHLGVTQAAISHYIHGQRATLLQLEDLPEVRSEVDKLAKCVAEDRINELQLASRITFLCDYVRKSRYLCSPHQKLEPGIDVENCHACDELFSSPEKLLISLDGLKENSQTP